MKAAVRQEGFAYFKRQGVLGAGGTQENWLARMFVRWIWF